MNFFYKTIGKRRTEIEDIEWKKIISKTFTYYYCSTYLSICPYTVFMLMIKNVCFIIFLLFFFLNVEVTKRKRIRISRRLTLGMTSKREKESVRER